MTAALTGAVGRFTTVPPEVACYDTDVTTASRSLSADAELIRALAGAGLPHVDDPERGPLFDHTDVMNVGFFCRTGETIPELGLRFLLRFASGPADSWYAARQWRVRVRPVGRISDDADGGGPDVAVRVPDLDAPGVEHIETGRARPAGPITSQDTQEFVVRLTGAPRRIADPRVRPVWDEIVGALGSGEVRYQTVPEALRVQPLRAWRMGIADCVVASRVLAARLADLGLRTRVRRGYLLGLFGSDHAWCELREDGVYKSLDPVFAFIAQIGDEAKSISRSPEFAEACFGSRFNRLLPCVGEKGDPLIYFDGAPAPHWAMAGVSARPWGVR